MRFIGVVVAHDNLRHSGYGGESTSSLYECCTRFFHAVSSGTVSLVCCAIVTVVRLMMGRRSRNRLEQTAQSSRRWRPLTR